MLIFKKLGHHAITAVFVIFILGGYVTGYLTITEKEDPCAHATSWREAYHCYEAIIPHIVKTQGVKAGISFVQNSVWKNWHLPIAHLAYHLVGHEAYNTFRDPQKALSYFPSFPTLDERGDYDYAFDGYRHGVGQKYFADGKKTTSMSDMIRTMCYEYFDITDPFENSAPHVPIVGVECFHIIGHSLMFAYDNDVFASLIHCDNLPYHWMKRPCYHGVFMENAYAVFYRPDVPLPQGKGTSLVPLCKQFAGAKLEECSRFVGWFILNSELRVQDKPKSFGKAFEECSLLPGSNAGLCVQEVGVIFIPPVFWSNFAGMIALCKSAGSDELTNYCLKGVAGGIRIGSAGKINSKKPFCSLLKTSYKEECNKVIEEVFTYGRHHKQ